MLGVRRFSVIESCRSGATQKWPSSTETPDSLVVVAKTSTYVR